MNVIEASFSGTMRTILVLLAAWWLLRYLMRRQAANSPVPGRAPRREKGHVTVERSTSDTRGHNGPGPVIIDADFEEIK